MKQAVYNHKQVKHSHGFNYGVLVIVRVQKLAIIIHNVYGWVPTWNLELETSKKRKFM